MNKESIRVRAHPRLGARAWLLAAALLAVIGCDLSRMQQTDILFGRVQDAAGNPVEGATVVAVSTIHEQEGDLHRSWNVTDISVLTDNNGDFTLEVSPPLGPRAVSGKECIALRLRHPGYADRHVARTGLGAYELSPVITLHAASTIEGRIEGWAVTSDMSVEASKKSGASGDPENWSATRWLGKGKTFQFENVPPGVIYLHLAENRKSSDSPFPDAVRLSKSQSLRLEPGESKAIVFQREDVGEITGVLRSADYGEALVLEVALCSGAAGGEHKTLTQWKGHNGSTFTLLNLTEPGKQFFLRINSGSTTFNYPLRDSNKRDQDVGVLNF